MLDWPAPGRMVRGFGPRLDPRYGTRVPHNGIELAVEPGTPVRAVYPGKVLFAAPFRGYGPTVSTSRSGSRTAPKTPVPGCARSARS